MSNNLIDLMSYFAISDVRLFQSFFSQLFFNRGKKKLAKMFDVLEKRTEFSVTFKPQFELKVVLF